MRAIKPSQININRYGAITIHTGGIALRTGCTAFDYGRVGATTVSIWKGKWKNPQRTAFEGDCLLEYPADQPFPAAEFLAAVRLGFVLAS